MNNLEGGWPWIELESVITFPFIYRNLEGNCFKWENTQDLKICQKMKLLKWRAVDFQLCREQNWELN